MDASNQDNSMKITHIIDIPKDKIGLFVGKSGSNIKYKIVLPTKREYLGESEKGDEQANAKWKECKVYCHVKQNEDEVTVELSAPNEECLSILKTKVDNFVKQFQNNSSKKKDSNQRTYSFRLNISEHFTGKLIGIEGSNIQRLSETIQTQHSLEKNPYIRFVKKLPKNATDIFIDGFDSGEIGVIIKIKGDKCFASVMKLLTEYVKDTLQSECDSGDEQPEESW